MGSRTLKILLLVCIGLAFTFAMESNETTDSKDEEHVETFPELEKKVKTSIGNAIKAVLPFLMRGSSDAHVSGQCTASIMKVIGGIRQLKEWGMRFIDATGKLPPGILEGTSFSIGDYDECLDIEVGKRDDKPKRPEDIAFTGQYCLLELHRPEAINRAIKDYEDGNLENPIAKTKTFLNMFVRYKHLTNSTMKLGVCVPSKCSQEDIENVMNSEALQNQVGKVTVSYCQGRNKEDEISTEQIILLCILGFYIFCVLLGTVADAFLTLQGKSEENTKPKDLSLMRLLVKKTSIYHNALNVLKPESSTPILCLCGLRTFIVILIIYSHTYAHLHLLHFQKFSKAANFMKFFDSFTFSGIGNGSVVLDSIVLISGVVITYTRWRFLPKGGKVVVNGVKLFFQQFIRFSAAQLLVICVFLLFPLIGSGPFWQAYVNPMLDNCHRRWWVNILYISNFWETTELCLYHTWVLSLILQLTLLGILVLWILKKSSTVGILFMVFVILAGIIGVGVMTVLHDLPGSLAFYMLDKRSFPIIWRDIYIKPYDHMGPFCIGLLVGYFLAIKKDRLEIPKIFSAVLWCSCIATTMAVMFGLYSYRKGDKIDVSLATFYAVMHRNAWSMGVGWMIIACSTHHGGPVSRVLKSNVFIVLDRLCYMAYLIHLPIMFYHSGSIRERWYMGHLEILFLGVGYIGLSFIASFILNIFFVEPYFAMEEHVCSLFKSRNKVVFVPSPTDKRSSSSIPSTINDPQEISIDSSGCENFAYSKNQDRN